MQLKRRPHSKKIVRQRPIAASRMDKAKPSSGGRSKAKRKGLHDTRKKSLGVPMSVMRYAVRLIDPPAIAGEADEKPF
jgi:hypothetical protein